MKIRIKGNSIRLRLSRPEVDTISNTGFIGEQTNIAGSIFKYTLQAVDNEKELSAIFRDNTITVFIPREFVRDWPANDVVGFKADVPLTGKDSLFIVIEKDFICLDETSEDQSDNYENPNQTC